MNNDIEMEVAIKRDYITELIANNYTQEELLNLIIDVLNIQGNEVAAAKNLAANLELFAS